MTSQNAGIPDARRRELTDDELRALAYFAIGVASEGSRGGMDVSNSLSFAGKTINGRLDPEGNSGYSIGTLQVDMGAHPEVATALVDAYQGWTRTNHADWVLDERQRARTTADLGRDGHAITAQAGRPLDAGVKAHLNAFLQSPEGIEFVHAHDSAQVQELMGGVFPRLRQTALFRDATEDDQVRLATMLGKLQNQGGNNYTPAVLRDIGNGTHRSVADVSAAIDHLLPRVSGRGDYLETGRDNALKGAEAFIALRNSSSANSMHEAWSSVLANPLVTPTRLDRDAAHPDLPAQYATTKTLFMQYEQAPAFIHALEQGGSYKWGRPQRDANGAATAGLYAAGDDFVVWNAAGQGHSRVAGTWAEVARDDLTRRNNPDRTTDLLLAQGGVERRLLHVDPAAPPMHVGQSRRRGEHAQPVPVDAALPGRATQATVHPLHEQAREAVRRLDAGLGRCFDETSERLSASAARLAQEHGFQRIDHILLNERTATLRAGESLFVVQGRLDDPAHRVASMRTDVAVQTPVAESQERLVQHDRIQLPTSAAQAPPLTQEPHRRVV
ncbi:XVIPCD domain-containing protein [Lysobacter fragariae]